MEISGIELLAIQLKERQDPRRGTYWHPLSSDPLRPQRTNSTKPASPLALIYRILSMSS